MKLNTIALFGILAILSSCSGQNTSSLSTGYSIEHDLGFALGDSVLRLDESIWVIFQDTKNRHWFGSDGQGVYQYDGHTLVRFSMEHGLPSNRIRGIQEDKSGNLFITTLNGICKFDGRTFSTLSVVESNDWNLKPDDLWFSILGTANDGGPYRFDGQTLHHLKLPKSSLEDEYYKSNPNTSYSPYDVYSIYNDLNGNIWFGTSNFGLCRYNGISHDWLYEDHWTNTPEGGSFGIRSIIEDREGNFWFCNTTNRYTLYTRNSTGQDQFLVDYEVKLGIDNLETPHGKDVIYFMSAAVDDTGDMWMATYDLGVWKYDGTNVTRHPVLEGPDDTKLFSIYKDRKGVLWLGTLESGAYRFNGEAFEEFKP